MLVAVLKFLSRNDLKTMGSKRASTNFSTIGIFLLIYNTLQKVIQQVHATGPLVSQVEIFWGKPTAVHER